MQVSVRLLAFGNISKIGLGPSGEANLEFPIGTSVDDLITSLNFPQLNPVVLVNGESIPIEKRQHTLLLDADELTIFPALKGG